MKTNQDFKDLFSILNTCRVRYLVAGAHAVMQYAEPRFTKDIDIWIDPTQENARRVWKALMRFGAPLQGIAEDDFANPQLVYQMGVLPNRVDIMMAVGGIRFSTAWRNRKRIKYCGVTVNVMGRREIIRAKRMAGRPQDLLDLASLEQAAKLACRRKASPRRHDRQ